MVCLLFFFPTVVYSVITGTSTDNEDRKEIIKIRRLPSHREAIHSLIVISGLSIPS